MYIDEVRKRVFGALSLLDNVETNQWRLFFDLIDKNGNYKAIYINYEVLYYMLIKVSSIKDIVKERRGGYVTPEMLECYAVSY